MDLAFTPHAFDEFCSWKDEDSKTFDKIKELFTSIQRTPFKGLGKPEALKNDLKGYWSRRISGEHRLVYKVTGKKGVDQKCVVIQCKFHYDK